MVAHQIRDAARLRLPARRLRRRADGTGSATVGAGARHRRRTCRASSRRYGIDRIVVGLSDRRGQLPIEELLHAKMAGVRVEDAATTYERMTGKILRRRSQAELADLLRRLPGLARDAVRQAACSISCCAIDLAIVLAAPLMVLTAIAVRLDSPGPMLYCQERVGENGRLFTLCKFRSMRTDAEKRQADLGARTTTTGSPASAASSA